MPPYCSPSLTSSSQFLTFLDISNRYSLFILAHLLVLALQGGLRNRVRFFHPHRFNLFSLAHPG